MRGHTSNRILLAHFKSLYELNKWERDRRTGAHESEGRTYFQGKMDQIVVSAIMFQFIKDRSELEEQLDEYYSE